MRISIPMPYVCQFDNALYPGGSCNMTSAAMVLGHFDLAQAVPGSRPRCADRLLQYCDDHVLDRHALPVIRDLLVKFGCQDDASYSHTFDEIKAHLDTKCPVIVQGDFTDLGHVVVVVGYDSDKSTWIVCDPAGDHTAPNGYREPGWRPGDHVEYSSSWFRAKAAPDGDGRVWAHLLKKR